MDTHEVTGTMEELKGKAEKNYGRLRDRAGEVQEEMETFSDSAQRNAEAAWENTIELIRENPGSSIAIAVLVGAGLGALLMAWATE